MPYKILHLDDDRQLLMLLKMMLSSGDYQVVSMHDARVALELAKVERPDLVFVDINLPHMNGVEFAAQMKATPELRHIPLIALTANAMHGDREFYLEHNFVGYLAKPVLRHELLHTLKQFLPSSSTQA
jgi:CheY-like chemotaxis protein